MPSWKPPGRSPIRSAPLGDSAGRPRPVKPVGRRWLQGSAQSLAPGRSPMRPTTRAECRVARAVPLEAGAMLHGTPPPGGERAQLEAPNCPPRSAASAVRPRQIRERQPRRSPRRLGCPRPVLTPTARSRTCARRTPDTANCPGSRRTASRAGCHRRDRLPLGRRRNHRIRTTKAQSSSSSWD